MPEASLQLALVRLSTRGCNLNFGPVANQPLDERTIRGSRPVVETISSIRAQRFAFRYRSAQMVRFVPQSSSPPPCFRKVPPRGSRFDRNSRIEDTGCAKVTDLGYAVHLFILTISIASTTLQK